MSPKIRLAEISDVPLMQAIERDALARHADDPIHAFVVHLPTREPEEFDAVFATGIAYVAVSEADAPIGFILALPVDGRAHLMELAVKMDQQRKGLGSALMAKVEQWARAQGFQELTLTAFRDLAWQAPAYARKGFKAFAPGPDRVELAKIRDEETDAGYADAPRIAMVKQL